MLVSCVLFLQLLSFEIFFKCYVLIYICSYCEPAQNEFILYSLLSEFLLCRMFDLVWFILMAYQPLYLI